MSPIFPTVPAALLAVALAGFCLPTADASGPARVVVDQRTGTVVITGEARIGTVAVTAGGLTVRTGEAAEVSQPGPFSRAGRTVAVPRTRVQVDEGQKGRLVVLPANADLNDLVARLNGLGLKPRELIQVLQAIKAAGALQADLIVR
ncbi:MAG TPA: flagellar basal body P-ring protein FlgI [Rhodospirillales bacterium]|jgi:flagellar P-ring protein precursor FlgI